MDTVALPVCNREPQQATLLVKKLVAQEPMLLKVIQQFFCLSLLMNTEDSRQCRQLADPLAGSFHVLLISDSAGV